jgi:hypothetical protein
LLKRTEKNACSDNLYAATGMDIWNNYLKRNIIATMNLLIYFDIVINYHGITLKYMYTDSVLGGDLVVWNTPPPNE